MEGHQGLFLDSLARENTSITCFLHTPLPEEMPRMNYRIQCDNIHLVSLPPHYHVTRRLLTRNRMVRAIAFSFDELDVFILRGPSPLLPAFSRQLIKKNTPYSFLLVGDYLKSLRDARVPLYKRAPLWLYYSWNKWLQDRYARDCMVVTNSHLIRREYAFFNRNIQSIATSTIHEADLCRETVRPVHEHAPVQLLYTGRIDPSKGLDELLAALQLLQGSGKKYQLHIVGWEYQRGYLAVLKKKARKYGIAGQTFFHGVQPLKKPLFDRYKKADIFLCPSVTSEGFPRTIWEAMAHRVPVIATRVGAIPYYLENNKNALLVDKKSPQQIALAIRRLAENKQLYHTITENALKLAEESTLEIQSLKMTDYLQRFIRSHTDTHVA